MPAIDASGLSAQAQTALSSAGLSTDQLQAAVTNLTGIDSTAQNAILSAASGVVSSGASVNSVANLVAAGFAATGVGAPVAAAITLGLPLVEGLANLLGASPSYAWMIGGWGVHKGTSAPYGPTDPRWLTFGGFFQSMLKGQLFGYSSPFNTLALGNLDNFIPGMTQIVHEENEPKPKTPQDTFRSIYNAAWEKNAEFIFNGHQWVPPYTLLLVISRAWNATHSGSKKTTIGPSGGKYINNLLGGQYDGQDHPPITLNIGPSTKVAAPPAAVVKHVLALTLPHLAKAVQKTTGAPPAAVTVAVKKVLKLHLAATPAAKAAAAAPLAAVQAPAAQALVGAVHKAIVRAPAFWVAYYAQIAQTTPLPASHPFAATIAQDLARAVPLAT